MKKILTTMFAVLVVAAMGSMFSADAWAISADDFYAAEASTTATVQQERAQQKATTPKPETKKTGTPANSQTRQTNSESHYKNTSEQTKNSWGGGFSFNGAAIMNNLNNGKGSFLQNLAGGILGSVSGSGSMSNAGTYVNSGNGSGNVGSVYTGGAGGMGVGGYMGMAGGTMASLGSAIWGTVTAKLLDLFGNVKMVLYILAAFGLVGFAFMALFGKVRWGWVCALAFGLAAVAAAGQIIDYVSGAGVGGAMYDTLGTNMY